MSPSVSAPAGVSTPTGRSGREDTAHGEVAACVHEAGAERATSSPAPVDGIPLAIRPGPAGRREGGRGGARSQADDRRPWPATAGERQRRRLRESCDRAARTSGRIRRPPGVVPSGRSDRPSVRGRRRRGGRRPGNRRPPRPRRPRSDGRARSPAEKRGPSRRSNLRSTEASASMVSGPSGRLEQRLDVRPHGLEDEAFHHEVLVDVTGEQGDDADGRHWRRFAEAPLAAAEGGRGGGIRGLDGAISLCRAASRTWYRAKRRLTSRCTRTLSRRSFSSRRSSATIRGSFADASLPQGRAATTASSGKTRGRRARPHRAVRRGRSIVVSSCSSSSSPPRPRPRP